MRRPRNDRPFYGNGTRFQNVWGRPARWYQVSFDTGTPAGKGAQSALMLFYVVVIVAVVVSVLVRLI